MLKKVSLAEQAYTVLVKKIISGEYPAGMRLTEEGLCDTLGVSRSPVRETLRKLISDGLVEALPRRGYQVSERDGVALRELFECRSRVEQLALESAISEIPEKKLLALREILLKQDSCETMRKNSLEADEKLHALLGEYCANRYIRTMAQQLLRQTMPYRNFRNYDTAPAALASERLALIDAIIAGDFDKASGLLGAHIMQGCPGLE